MLPPGEPKFRRRPAERPAEILAAALEVFAARGYAATRLEDVARRAGVSKGALYLYFETKEDLFRAVVETAVGGNLAHLKDLAGTGVAFETAVRAGVGLLAQTVASDRRVSGVVRLVIVEGRNLPELATIWHETVVVPALGVITGLIRAGQARGEVRCGDPRLFAMGLMGPMLLGVLWRETFEPIGAEPVDIEALAAQHLDTVLGGMRP
ncbi:TetR/AcrR family transcriptional regulator [uncultured Brevundimonas sp.]|uniref:TetR/AcrR family transcriptional regulator n=1 Tax=uncultured Brevundimonas sp. TaxID=213418 RepID=UPI0030EC8323|tara:strand:- start:2137 stop:2763 length:627 start_codon:yes stop_codon:yes gene_type:complete